MTTQAAAQGDKRAELVKQAKAVLDAWGSHLTSMPHSPFTLLKKSVDQIEADGTELARLRDQRAEMLATLKDLLALVKNTEHWSPKVFHNGVEHNGMDEGDVIAGRIIDAASTAILSAEGRQP